MMTPAMKRESDIQRVKDYGTADTTVLVRALNWTPELGCPISGDAIRILERKGFFK